MCRKSHECKSLVGFSPWSHKESDRTKQLSVCACIYMGYYSAIKKNEIMPFAAIWMDLEIVIVSEVGQTEKDKDYMILLKRRI